MPSKAAQKQRRISPAGDDTSHIENVKTVLEYIQETLKNIVTKDDISKNIVAKFKDEIREKSMKN
jgi:hypothetical protein